MKLNYTAIFSLTLFSFLFTISSCKNDVDVFASGSDVTVVYGLLNVDDTLHQIKINKVFQGDKAVSDLAQDPTVSEYDQIEAQIIELSIINKDSVPTGRYWPLTEVIITNKDSGYFYYPDQKVYEFRTLTDKLISSNIYKIVIDKLNDSPVVEASTVLIGNKAKILTKPLGLSIIGLSLANADGPIDEIDLEMAIPTNGKVIEVYLDFTWRDEFLDGTMSDYQTISYKVGTYVTSRIPTTPADLEIVKGSLIPTSFFEFIAAKIPVVTTSDMIKQRIPNQPLLDNMPLQFRFITGGDDLNTYLEVASPSTSILETKPEYTNVINGVGLFSTRTFDIKNTGMSKFTWDYLVSGEITAGRKFCNAKNNTSDESCY